MMLMVSNLVYNIIKTFDDENAKPFDGDVFPLVAPIESTVPFVVYRVSKSPVFSKKSVQDVNVTITIVGRSYESICSLSDALELHFQNHPDFEYQSTDPGVNPDDPSEMNFQIGYNLKMI